MTFTLFFPTCHVPDNEFTNYRHKNALVIKESMHVNFLFLFSCQRRVFDRSTCGHYVTIHYIYLLSITSTFTTCV